MDRSKADPFRLLPPHPSRLQKVGCLPRVRRERRYLAALRLLLVAALAADSSQAAPRIRKAAASRDSRKLASDSRRKGSGRHRRTSASPETE